MFANFSTIRPSSNAVDITSRKWGLVPNGTGDAGEVINAAIQYASDNKIYEVYIPAGVYNLEQPIEPLDNVSIYGSGWQTILKVKNNTDIYAITSPEIVYSPTIANFAIDMNGSNNAFPTKGDAINIHMDHGLIHRIRILNNTRIGIRIGDDPDISDNSGSYLNIIQYSHIASGTHGIKWGWRHTDGWCLYNNIGSSTSNLYVQGGTARFIGNHLNGSPEYNIYIPDGCDTMFFSENIMENAGKHAFYVPKVGYRNAVYRLSINNNIIRNCSREANDTYSLIHIEGYDLETRSESIVVNGNMLTCSSGRRSLYPVNISLSKSVSVVGNIFNNSYVDPEEKVLFTDVEGLEYIGNAG